MNDNSTEIRLLMDYLDDVMSPEERVAFELKLKSDPVLTGELNNLQSARDTVKLFGLKQKVAAMHAEMIHENKPKEKPLRSMIGIAMRIAAVLIILLLINGIYQYKSLTSGRLYNDLYQPYSQSATRGESNLSGIEKAYGEHNNNRVLALFNGSTQHTAEDYFLAGNAYLQLDSASAAINCFTSVLENNRLSNSHRYEDDAEYYLALSYLANKEAGKAFPLFEKIHTSKGHAYHDKVSAWFLQKLHWLDTGK